MGVSLGPNGVKDGLIFSFDLNNQQKSWKGKPTTNYAANRSARVDNSYASFSATSSGAWNQNHPDAITVYNDSGSNISAYSNTGVTDWTNTYHAIWTLDSQLNRPVVTMRDVDGRWKAKSFSLGQTMTTMGLAAGSTYSISWLQWTDDIAKAIQAGLYGLNTGGTNNFNDGLSLGQSTSYNTLPYTWQRVYATFTVSSSWNMTAGIACYMYGHYVKRGTLKITDVQIEVGTPSGFSKSLTRSNNESLIDMINNQSITISDLTYDENGLFTFDGVNDYVYMGRVPNTGSSTVSFSMSVWVNPSSTSGNIVSMSSLFPQDGWNMPPIAAVDQKFRAKIWSNNYLYSSVYELNKWYYLTLVWKYSPDVEQRGQFFYVNGELIAQQTGISYGASGTDNYLTLGQANPGADNAGMFSGKIFEFQVYGNKALTSAEVKQNFNASRSRYNL